MVLRWLQTHAIAFSRAVLMLTSCLVAGAAFQARPAALEWKPEKNVEIIAPVAPGGSNDRTARVVQALLKAKGLVEAAVVNKPGGGGAVAWAYLNQHPGNGHYLSVTALGLVTNRITSPGSLNYTDVTPLAMLLVEETVFTARADSSIKTGKDLVERLKKNPQSVNIAFSSGLATVTYITNAVVMKAAGVEIKKLRTVAFNSAAEAMASLLGRHVDVIVTGIPAVVPQMQAGTVRVIAIAASQRLSGALAKVPTWKEQGVDVAYANWRGIVGPKAMNQEQIAYWDGVFARLTGMGEWKDDLEKNLQKGLYLSSTEFRKFLDKENDRVTATLTELGLARQ